MQINPQEFIVDIPDLHPASNDYLNFWRDQFKYSVEGNWLGGHYMPPSLYFYSNIGIIQLNKGNSNVKSFGRPWLRDLEWQVFNYYTACRGFSGFENDDTYSSHYALLDPLLDDEYLRNKYPNIFQENGERKIFVHPLTTLSEFHEFHKGAPLFENEAWNGMVLGSRDTGKDLQEDSLVYTKQGPKKIKDVLVGDRIYDPRGQLTEVISKTNYEDQLQYQVTLADGRSVECGAGHLWGVLDKKNTYKVLTLEQIYTTYQKYKRPSGKFDTEYFIPMTAAVMYDNTTLPLDPYYLGLWLGDGTSSGTGITTADQEISWYLYEFAKSNGVLVSKDQKSEGDAPTATYRLVTPRGKPNPTLNKLRELNVFKNKHVPALYKYASVTDRLSLLQGLLDTDGYIDKNGNVQYYSTNKQLALDALEICHSLGIRAKLTTKKAKLNGREISDCFVVNIISNLKLFRLSRKQDRINTRFRRYMDKVAIVDIKPTSIKPSVCIGVDNKDNLFLTTDYIVTHNSYMAAVGIVLKEWLFDGLTSTKAVALEDESAVDITVGAEDSQKSTLLLNKTKAALERLPGAKMVNGRYYPAPFSKQYQGSWNVGKQVTADYEKKYPGGWKQAGSQGMIKHRSFKDNPFADQGARNLVIVLEEIGMFNLLKQVVHNTRDNLQDGDRKIGSLWMMGTGGDMDSGTLDAADMFYQPAAYDILSFNDEWENRGQIGFFIPAYMSVNSFKDSRGITDIPKAIEYWEKKRQSVRLASKGSEELHKLMQYRPLKPSEMFLSRSSNIFPVYELQQRFNLIKEYKIYDYLEKKVQLFFDKDSAYNGVNYEIDTSLTAINQHPWNSDNVEGATVIYELPQLVNGVVPQNAYIIGCDPFRDNTTGGNSFAAIYVMKTAKYPSIIGHDEIVASYIGRPYFGMAAINELLYKLSLFYGNAKIYFENNVGNIKDYFEKIKRLDLLASQPTTVLNKRASYNTNPSLLYGYSMSSEKVKWEAIQYIRTWLLQERETVNGVTKRNLDLINCPYLLKQLISFNMDGNFDAVMGLVGCIIGLEELYNTSRSTSEALQYSALDQEFLNIIANNKKLFNGNKLSTSKTFF